MDSYRDLFVAVREGNITKVTEIVDLFGLSYSSDWSNGYALLREAVRQNHTEIAKFLLINGAEVNNKDLVGETPLYYAIKNDNKEIVEVLLVNGADLYYVVNCGAPLYWAISQGNVSIVETLLNHGACVDLYTHGSLGTTPLQDATSLNNTEMIKVLVKKGADINTVSFQNPLTPLFIAIKNNSIDALEFLFNEVDINVECENQTPLYFAIKNGCAVSVEEILKYPKLVDEMNRTYLQAAAQSSQLAYKNIVDNLLKYGFEINAEDLEDVEFLFTAVKNGHSKIVEQFLELGVNVNEVRNSKGYCLLYYAIMFHHANIIKLLFKYGANVNIKLNSETEAISMHSICLSDRKFLKTFEVFLLNEANIEENFLLLHGVIQFDSRQIVLNLKSKKRKRKNSLGFESNYTVMKKIVNMLLEKGVNVNADNEDGFTPLYYAIFFNHVEIVELLLKHNANPNVIYDHETGESLLHMSIKNGNETIVKLLLNYGCDVLVKTNEGFTALHYAASDGARISNEWAQNFPPKKILRKKRKKNQRRFLTGGHSFPDGEACVPPVPSPKPPLYAAQHGYKIVDALLRHNVEVDSRTKNGDTALHFAVTKNDFSIVGALLKFGCNVNFQDANGLTPLHTAVTKNYFNIVDALLKSGSDVNFQDANGLIPLHIAVTENHFNIVDALLKSGSDANFQDADGLIPLHIAVTENHFNIVDALLEVDSNVDFQDKNGLTPLHIACKKLNFKIIKSLLDSYPDINIVDNIGQIPFQKIKKRSLFHNEYNMIVRMFTKYKIKMITANLYPSDENLQLTWSYDDDSSYVTGFQEMCEIEVAKMKSVMISSNLSLYDILIKNLNQVASFLKIQSVQDAVTNVRAYGEYPIYGSLIKCRFKKGLRRKKFLEEMNLNNSFSSIFPGLPHDCIEHIFVYLSNVDIQNLLDA